MVDHSEQSQNAMISSFLVKGRAASLLELQLLTQAHTSSLELHLARGAQGGDARPPEQERQS
jgi:hypothetical protein